MGMGPTVAIGALDEDRHERTRRVGWIDLDRLSSARVLVVGAGALGNEAVKNLVLSGVHRITIVDMDRVVRSNLSRCLFFTEEDARRRESKAEVLARRAGEMDPEARVEAIISKVEDVQEEAFQASDLVLGCLDNIAARLHVNAHCYRHSRPLVDGGTMGTSGKVQVAIPPEGPCLQCAMNQSHYRVMERRFSCSGAETVLYEPKMAAEITTTSVIAAIQVREGLKILSGRCGGCLHHLLLYDGLRNRVMELEVELDPECQMHVEGHIGTSSPDYQ